MEFFAFLFFLGIIYLTTIDSEADKELDEWLKDGHGDFKKIKKQDK